MEQGYGDQSSSFAEEGTAAHEVCASALSSGYEADHYLGWNVLIVNGKVKSLMPAGTVVIDPTKDIGGKVYPVDQNMVDHVQTYLDIVRGQCETKDSVLFVEQRVSHGQVIGVEDQFGTSDATVVCPGLLIVDDFKYGMGVQVDAERNEQLMLYALGALDRYGHIHHIKRVRMVVIQPRIENLSEWECSVEELIAFGKEARVKAQLAQKLLGTNDPDVLMRELHPGEKQCKFCKAKRDCPALSAMVSNAIADDFVDMDDISHAERQFGNAARLIKDAAPDRLSVAGRVLPLVEQWVKGVREGIYLNLMRGTKVKYFKLVRGKQGNRAWASPEQAEAIVKAAIGEAAYDKSLISPTTAEKLMKKSNPAAWELAQSVIMRKPGSLSVAPETDPRAEEMPQAEVEAMFTDETGEN